MNGQSKRLDALERQAFTYAAAGGRSREILAARLAQMAERVPARPGAPDSPAQRVVADALAAPDFWPAVTRGLRAYLNTRAA
jgi:hypothetical protein